MALTTGEGGHRYEEEPETLKYIRKPIKGREMPIAFVFENQRG